MDCSSGPFPLSHSQDANWAVFNRSSQRIPANNFRKVESDKKRSRWMEWSLKSNIFGLDLDYWLDKRKHDGSMLQNQKINVLYCRNSFTWHSLILPRDVFVLIIIFENVHSLRKLLVIWLSKLPSIVIHIH